jgi:hypothetical protein
MSFRPQRSIIEHLDSVNLESKSLRNPWMSTLRCTGSIDDDQDPQELLMDDCNEPRLRDPYMLIVSSTDSSTRVLPETALPRPRPSGLGPFQQAADIGDSVL